MGAAKTPLTVAIVGTPEAGASGTMAIMDVLVSVGRGWEMMHGEKTSATPFRPRLLTIDGAPYRQPNGILVTPHGSFADYPRPDIVIVPELVLGIEAPLPEHYDAIAEWMKAAHAAGAILCSVCSGTLLLARTGLLDGEDATTHWGYCDALKRRHPQVRVRKERILVAAGTGHSIVTAGGASSWYDLLLYLVARFAGADTARRVAKMFLVQAHEEGQLPFAGLTAKRQHDDKLVAEAQLWLAENYAEPNPVAAMAGRSGLSERSFHNRFKRATGMSPIEYVQTLRIEEAKHLLETGTVAIDDVAFEVGYAEPASFRRLFQRMVGLSPSAYRRRRLLPALAEER